MPTPYPKAVCEVRVKIDKGKNTVETLEFVVAQFFVAFMGIALPQEFTSSTKTNFEGVSFPIY